jgi:hypothetical protein
MESTRSRTRRRLSSTTTAFGTRPHPDGAADVFVDVHMDAAESPVGHSVIIDIEREQLAFSPGQAPHFSAFNPKPSRLSLRDLGRLTVDEEYVYPFIPSR